MKKYVFASQGTVGELVIEIDSTTNDYTVENGFKSELLDRLFDFYVEGIENMLVYRLLQGEPSPEELKQLQHAASSAIASYDFRL